MLAPAMMPEIDEMLITEPPSLCVCFLISATPCLQPRNTPSRSMACTLRHSSSVMSSTVLLRPMPAEFSSTCNAPYLSTVSVMTAFQLSSDVTSSFTKWPAEPSLSATALPRSAAMSATTTLAPSCAISDAALAPSPEAPPVIRATLPARRSVIFYLPPRGDAPDLPAPAAAVKPSITFGSFVLIVSSSRLDGAKEVFDVESADRGMDRKPCCFGRAVVAQDSYPNRAVRWIVPFPAGG